MSALSFNTFCDGIERVLAPAGENHLGASLAKGKSAGFANPRARACDPNHFALEAIVVAL
jgi:hypothetical protein